jgi:hypothetical protein
MKTKHTNDGLGRRGRHLGVAGAITALALAGSVPALIAAASSLHVSAALDTRLVAAVETPPSPFELEPPGETSGPPTDFHESGMQPYFYSAHGDYPYQITSNPDGTGDVVGTYDVHESVNNFFGIDNREDTVFDSMGMAPADGTVYDQFLAGVTSTPFFGALLLNYSVSGPAGTQDLFESLGIVNYFSSTPDGALMDTLYLFGTPIPILDIPASDTTDLADAGDVAGLTDLGAL